MAIDINALRDKLNALANKKNRSDVLWKPQEGTNQIRIVPFTKNPDNPFIEIYCHYLGGKTYLSPVTFGEADPIAEFADQLRAGGGLTKEEWSETKKFVPKMRTYAPIVVRGKESEGVKFWGFGKTIYQELLSIIADPEYGDITDPAEGRDIKVEFIPKEKSSTKEFPETSIRISPKQGPITTDKELLNKVLTVQPDVFDGYQKLSYEELKDVLNKFLSPSKGSSAKTTSASAGAASNDDWGTSSAAEPTTVTESPTAQKAKAAESPSKQNFEKEFEEMFAQ